MKKVSLGLLALAAIVLAFGGVAMAETVSGKILSVDAAGNQFSVSSESELAAGGKADLLAGEDTVYTGVASLADLKEGQEVSVEIEKDSVAGVLHALSVSLVEVPAEAPAVSETAAEPAAEAAM